jgi:hypothetical protein
MAEPPTMHVYVKLDGTYETAEIGNGPVRIDGGEQQTMADMVAVLRAVADDVERQGRDALAPGVSGQEDAQ